jgi:hypothetical protein
MAVPNSSLFSGTLISALTDTASETDINAAGVTISLYTDYALDPAAATAVGYTATGELATANGYTRPGIALPNRTFGVVSGIIYYQADDAVWTSPTTLSAINGCLIYDTTPTTTPCADPGIAFIKFGTAGSSGGGSFTVQWADGVNGQNGVIFYIDPQP